MKKKISLFFLFCTTQFYGQENLSYKNNKIDLDTSYIKNLSDKLIVKLFIDNKVDSYNFYNKNSDETFTILPNLNSKISVSLDYEVFSFVLSVPKKWTPFKTDDEFKGKTENISFSFGVFLNNWYQTFYFSNTKGYYIANTGNFFPEWRQGIDPYLQLPNYRVRKIEGTTSYILNGNRFSYRSFLYQTQIQKKSAGSFIPSLNYSYLYQSDDNQEHDYTYHGDVFYISAILAYQYNWVISHRLYFSTGANIGIGFRTSNENTQENSSQRPYHHTSLSNTIGFNANLNYQNKNIFCGLKGIASGVTAKDTTDSSLNNSIFYGVIYLGYRFDTPDRVSKTYNKISKKGL